MNMGPEVRQPGQLGLDISSATFQLGSSIASNLASLRLGFEIGNMRVIFLLSIHRHF